MSLSSVYVKPKWKNISQWIKCIDKEGDYVEKYLWHQINAFFYH